MSGGGGGDNKVEETQAQKEQSRIAIDKFNDYQTRFAPLEDRLMSEVRTTGAEYDQGEGQAAAASEQQFAGARQQYGLNQFSRGANLASGAYQAGMGDLGRSEAQATGLNVAGSGDALTDQETYGLVGVTQIGRGQSATALSQYGQASSMAQQQAINDARVALDESLANQQFFGQVVGAGAGIAQGGLAQKGSQNAGLTSVGSTVGYGDSARKGLDYSISSSAGTSGKGLTGWK